MLRWVAKIEESLDALKDPTSGLATEGVNLAQQSEFLNLVLPYLRHFFAYLSVCSIILGVQRKLCGGCMLARVYPGSHLICCLDSGSALV